MFSPTLKPSRWLVTTVLRCYRSIPPRLRFYMDTKSVYGPQKTVVGERPSQSSELDLRPENPKKKAFENETALLYGPPDDFHRVCSMPKGVSIAERHKYIRDLFRVPRGHRLSAYPQAYVPNKYLGSRQKKQK